LTSFNCSLIHIHSFVYKYMDTYIYHCIYTYMHIHTYSHIFSQQSFDYSRVPGVSSMGVTLGVGSSFDSTGSGGRGGKRYIISIKFMCFLFMSFIKFI
jgi:hypothetical protein